MNKNQIIIILENRFQELQKIASRSFEQVEGDLQWTVDRGKVRYYQRTVPGKPRKYLGSNSQDLIRLLAEKKYRSELKKAAGEEMKRLDKCLLILKDGCPVEQIYPKLPEPIRKFVQPDKETDEGKIREWQSRKYGQMDIDKGKAFRTLRGDYVRSKSEVIIADRLLFHKVPYHYERVLFFERYGEFCPDFYVLNKRTMKAYYWEHFGIMDDPRYSCEAVRKMVAYTENGIIQGKNLLVSYETSINPLKTEYIDELIKSFLL